MSNVIEDAVAAVVHDAETHRLRWWRRPLLEVELALQLQLQLQLELLPRVRGEPTALPGAARAVFSQETGIMRKRGS